VKVAALPGDFRLAFSTDVMELSHVAAGAPPGTRASGVLLGGDPFRLLRLSPAGSIAITRLRRGDSVQEAGPGAGRLARTLVEYGIAEAIPGSSVPTADQVTIAIPVLDRAASLRRLLASLDAPGPVVVVDDGSRDGSGEVARSFGAQVLRHEVPRGPAAARNAALAAAATPYVAFLDSDCLPLPGWLTPLLTAMADPVVAVAAPRVRSTRGQSLLERYERARSPLDLGARSASVRPGGRVPYVPSAALLIRRAAVPEDCFDIRLRHGEDVDLIWRLREAGWSVRYTSRSVVEHDPRPDLRAWLAQRSGYGGSAAPLELRHPGTLRPMPAGPTGALPWLVAAAGAPGPGAALLAATAVFTSSRLARRLGELPKRRSLAVQLALRAQPWAVRQAADVLTRGWLPLALLSRAGRRAVLAAAVIPPAVDWWRSRPDVPLPAYLGLRFLDDAAYCAGVWRGCLRERTLRPLLPALPGTGPATQDGG
jgi:mycofactocin system glycosyltransferase